MERKFIKSGIPGLDEVLGGGLLEGSIVTVSGPTGSGKSTFAAQFIHNGAAESGEPGLYISLEESRRDFLFHMSGYEWDFTTLEHERKFILLDYPIHEVDQIVNQSSAIQEIINSTGVKRVVVDSIMPIALYFKGDDERRTGFLKFIENLRKWNTTTIIVSEDMKNHPVSRPGSEYAIESFTDGWINLFFKYDDKKGERMRYLEAVKMKGVAHSSRSYPVSLTERGFSIREGTPGRAAQPTRPPKAEKPPKASPPEEPPEEPPAPRTPARKRLAKPPPPPKQATKEQPKEAAKGAKEGKAAPVKMTPTLYARLAEAKSKIMKKK